MILYLFLDDLWINESWILNLEYKTKCVLFQVLPVVMSFDYPLVGYQMASFKLNVVISKSLAAIGALKADC